MVAFLELPQLDGLSLIFGHRDSYLMSIIGPTINGDVNGVFRWGLL